MCLNKFMLDNTETILFEKLDSHKFILYASRHYNNPGCTSIEEFYDDLKPFKYLARLFHRYQNNNRDLQIRLILNHLITLGNIFGVQPTIKMLLFKIKPEHYQTLKPFLIYLHYLDTDNQGELADVPLNVTIMQALNEI